MANPAPPRTKPAPPTIGAGPRPQPEGPEEVWKKFTLLNRRPRRDVMGHAADVSGKLDLKTGAAVVALAELATVFGGNLVEGYLGAALSGWLAVLLPLILVLLHRKGKGKGEGAVASGERAEGPRTPEQVAAAFEASERGTFGRA